MEQPMYRAVAVLGGIFFLVLLLRYNGQNGSPGITHPSSIVVSVEGDVRNPGIHVLNGPSVTASQAIDAAGGCSMGALRYAAAGFFPDMKLQTGQLLRVAWKGAGIADVRVENVGAAALLVIGKKLDPNNLTKDELSLIPGMRDVFAESIVVRRKKRPWTSMKELDEIPGVGPKTVEKWKAYLEIPHPRHGGSMQPGAGGDEPRPYSR
jgi:competence protein ComEA